MLLCRNHGFGMCSTPTPEAHNASTHAFGCISASHSDNNFSGLSIQLMIGLLCEALGTEYPYWENSVEPVHLLHATHDARVMFAYHVSCFHDVPFQYFL